jgi:hypothetical protein
MIFVVIVAPVVVIVAPVVMIVVTSLSSSST